MPDVNINHLNGIGMSEKFPEFCSKLFEYQIKEHDDVFNYIFESCDINPTQLKKYFNIENVQVLFLGYPRLTIEETIFNYKKYAQSGDYMIKKSDDEIEKRAIMWVQKSQQLLDECMKYNVKFIDVSYNRDEIFKKLVEELNIDE